MAAIKKTLSRSNKAQISHLINYMHEHPHFAAGEFKTPQGAVKQEKQWIALKTALDELGPSRSVEQWKICWRDQKRKARVESGALNKAQNQTGNVGEIPDLSQNSLIILDTIGEEMALGCGPEESPIGFSVYASELPAPETVAPPQVLPVVAAPPFIPPVPPSPSVLPATVQTTPPEIRPGPYSQTRRRRTRIVTPPQKFIEAQLEMNTLMKELIKEVRQSNILKERNHIFMKRSHRRSQKK